MKRVALALLALAFAGCGGLTAERVKLPDGRRVVCVYNTKGFSHTPTCDFGGASR